MLPIGSITSSKTTIADANDIVMFGIPSYAGSAHNQRRIVHDHAGDAERRAMPPFSESHHAVNIIAPTGRSYGPQDFIVNRVVVPDQARDTGITRATRNDHCDVQRPMCKQQSAINREPLRTADD